MCRIFVRSQDGHGLGSASSAEKRLIWQAGDVVEILEDGVSGGAEGEAKHLIIEVPGVRVSAFASLLTQPTNLEFVPQATRISNLNLALLRAGLSQADRTLFDAGKVQVAKADIDAATKTRGP